MIYAAMIRIRLIRMRTLRGVADQRIVRVHDLVCDEMQILAEIEQGLRIPPPPGIHRRLDPFDVKTFTELAVSRRGQGVETLARHHVRKLGIVKVPAGKPACRAAQL